MKCQKESGIIMKHQKASERVRKCFKLLGIVEKPQKVSGRARRSQEAVRGLKRTLSLEIPVLARFLVIYLIEKLVHLVLKDFFSNWTPPNFSKYKIPC